MSVSFKKPHLNIKSRPRAQPSSAVAPAVQLCHYHIYLLKSKGCILFIVTSPVHRTVPHLIGPQKCLQNLPSRFRESHASSLLDLQKTANLPTGYLPIVLWKSISLDGLLGQIGLWKPKFSQDYQYVQESNPWLSLRVYITSLFAHRGL